MNCFDCDELQFHYGEGCDACTDSLVRFFPKNCVACKSCELACKCGALIYGQETNKVNPKAMTVDPAALAMLPLAKRDNIRHVG